MKNNIHTNPLLFRMILLFTCFMLVILYNNLYAATPSPLIINEKGAGHFQPTAEKHNLNVMFISDKTNNDK